MNTTEKELWQYLKDTEKPIVLYGMGNGADKIISVLEKYNIPFKGVFASDGFVRNKTFHGFKISSLKELEEKFGDMIVLLCFGSERPEVIEYIKGVARRHELYAPDVPVIGDGLFTMEFLKENAERFKAVYSLLADDLSRKTFKNIINFRLSGKPNYLFECSTPKDEPYKNFLSLDDNEHFMDLGAYNGDTVEDFITRIKNYKLITAVEPDAKSFSKLAANTENIENIKLVNAAISNICGIGFFDMKNGRNSSLGTSGTEAQLITIDKLSENTPPTYIKMDLEGEEINAIRGAFNTITNHRPKMLISAYHRTDDILTIPEEILKIRTDYKIYLRHFSALPAWDINYYFV